MNSEPYLPKPFRALLLGASGGIGAAFASLLRTDPDCAALVTVSRTTHLFFDLESADFASGLVAFLADESAFDLVIDATGVLSLDGKGPEKSLKTLDPGYLHRIFQINTFGPALLLKTLEPWLVKGPGCYAKLSARVGSIGDNHLGGWYGYRASKAALNMLLQSAAIELHRQRPQLRVLALQPGTVRTPLSAPHIGDSTHALDPETSAREMLRVIHHSPIVPGASFIDYRGQPIPW